MIQFDDFRPVAAALDLQLAVLIPEAVEQVSVGEVMDTGNQVPPEVGRYLVAFAVGKCR